MIRKPAAATDIVLRSSGELPAPWSAGDKMIACACEILLFQVSPIMPLDNEVCRIFAQERGLSIPPNG